MIKSVNSSMTLQELKEQERWDDVGVTRHPGHLGLAVSAGGHTVTAVNEAVDESLIDWDEAYQSKLWTQLVASIRQGLHEAHARRYGAPRLEIGQLVELRNEHGVWAVRAIVPHFGGAGDWDFQLQMMPGARPESVTELPDLWIYTAVPVKRVLPAFKPGDWVYAEAFDKAGQVVSAHSPGYYVVALLPARNSNSTVDRVCSAAHLLPIVQPAYAVWALVGIRGHDKEPFYRVVSRFWHVMSGCWVYRVHVREGTVFPGTQARSQRELSEESLRPVTTREYRRRRAEARAAEAPPFAVGDWVTFVGNPHRLGVVMHRVRVAGELRYWVHWQGYPSPVSRAVSVYPGERLGRAGAKSVAEAAGDPEGVAKLAPGAQVAYASAVRTWGWKYAPLIGHTSDGVPVVEVRGAEGLSSCTLRGIRRVRPRLTMEVDRG